MPSVRVFIENEAGSDVKHHHDEVRLIPTMVERVQAAFPYPYGFIPGTVAPDADAVDCFVITDRPLRTGDVVAGEVIGLMEQTDAGGANHNVLVVLPGDPLPDLEALREQLARFIVAVFRGLPGRESVAGRLRPVEDALAYLAECTPPSGPDASPRRRRGA
ncbi:MAG: inorganic diphosphatase [Acidimicrobiia bacterium]|nr:inorganic diphosphatase [Acidimicrobiia bacterium]